METGARVRAIHQDGVLKLLTPLELPEGTQVSVIVLPTPFDQVDPVYQTRLVPAKKLDKLTGLVSIGGDALADSEALYD